MNIIAKELIKIAKILMARPRELVCTKPGLVSVLKGDARSAEVKLGDKFHVDGQHGSHWLTGTVDIGGSMFRHDPGLSGQKTRPGLRNTGGMVFGVQVTNVDNPDDKNDFWAEWETVR